MSIKRGIFILAIFLILIITSITISLSQSIFAVNTFNVSISAPANLSQFTLRQAFNITSKVTCQVSSCGTVFATPRFNYSGSFPFTPINSTRNGETPLSIAVSKYSKNTFNRTYLLATNDIAYSAAADSNNNVYIIGTSGGDWQVMKLNATGKSIWNRTFINSGFDAAYGVALDSSNNIYIVGNISSNNGDWHIMKLNSTGGSIWNRTYDLAANSEDIAYSIVVDSSSNNIFVAGSKDEADWQVMKLNSTGKSIWNRTYDLLAAPPEFARDIAIDKGNNIYLVGQKSGYALVFVMKINATGKSIWNYTYSGGSNTIGNSIVVDKYNSTYIAGTDQEQTNAFINKISSSGSSLWIEIYDINANDEARSLAIDSRSNIYASGFAFNNNWLIMKIDPTNKSIWNLTYDKTGTDSANGIAIDSNNDIYVVGSSNQQDWEVMKFDNSLAVQSCGALGANGACVFEWSINATSLGGYSIGVYYNSSTAGLFNVTENITIRVGAPVTTTTSTSTTTTSTVLPTSTGGGGGGSKSVFDFSIYPDAFKVLLKPGQTLYRDLIIKNTGSRLLTDVSILPDMQDFIGLSDNKFSLKPGEEKIVTASFSSSTDKQPGIYNDVISVETSGIIKKILSIIEVIGLKPLFDIKVELAQNYQSITPGQTVDANIILYNFGDLKPVDIQLYYSLRDVEGNDIASKEEAIAVTEQKQITRSLSIPVDAKPGNYLFYSKIIYGENAQASGSSLFKMSAIQLQQVSNNYTMLIILGVASLLLILAITVLIRMIARYRKSLNYKSYYPMLRSEILSRLQQGYSKEQILESAKQAGWPESIVKSALQSPITPKSL